MEAATISSPQRKLNVVPVQKSLSLPSYARAGGEGIDHRVIFAALEQREKIRRKSRIFAREKTARQNIFCLPISSGNKCRETSLSSDTSCSSLEYQKPKAKPKKDEKPPNNETTANDRSTAKTNQPEAKPNPGHNDVAPRISEGDHDLQRNSLKAAESNKGYRSPSSTLRPNVNSSDSMDRSSRSSNDSLSRRERLVAIKAKVEAAREKYGDTSSEEENRSAITRYGSDGVIHRSVRDVKSRSHRLEKRLRRRSQDEYALKRANRKNNLSLCLNSTEDGIKLDMERSLNIYEDGQNLECKTDFCPSPNFLDFTRKNYFSDFPSKENMSRIVQTRIRHIEEEERKRRNSVDFRDKNKISSRQSPQNTDNTSPFSTRRKHTQSVQSTGGSLDSGKNSPCSDIVHCPSPIGRAPTPPPRSPKSITFVNKAYLQHQNSYINHESHSLERRFCFQPNIPVNFQQKSFDKIKSNSELNSNDSKASYNMLEEVSDKRKMRELFNARRKTCAYFDYSDNYTFKDLSSTTENPTFSKSTVAMTGLNISQPQSTDAKESSSSVSERRLLRSRWDETEKRQEFMFNSLESKKKVLTPSWMKSSSGAPNPNENCLCYVLSGRSTCTCHLDKINRNSRMYANSVSHSKTGNLTNYSNMKDLEAHQSCSRLSKSELNIAYSEQAQSDVQNSKSGAFCNLQSSKEKLECIDQDDKLSATANLESAMEELESVYRSLKFSSDNLSDKNSTSNFSLNDLNAETSKNNIFGDTTNKDHHTKTNSNDSNFNIHSTKPSSMKPLNDEKHLNFQKLSVYSPNSEMMSSSMSKSTESESLCIDELFNDLTRQLDIEQKLLKESRDNRNGHRMSNLHSRNESPTSSFHSQIDNRISNLSVEKCDKRDQKRMTPLESIVSIRKELYDNLQKSNQEHSTRSFSPTSKIDKNENSQLEMAKKRYQAVRSLSENISYLMASSHTNPSSIKKIPIEKSESSSCNSGNFVNEKSSPTHYEHMILEPLKRDSKKEMLNHPAVPVRTFMIDKQKIPLNEEIRQIRVSMDSNSTESRWGAKKQFSEYPRLTSAVCNPQISPKNVTCAGQPPHNNVTGISKDPVDVLDENGLEKLLNTLLNEVPEPKQSSLLLTKDDTPATPPPTASSGEMRVLKHLDILRLNPIPS